ncbi:MAG: ABC transporter substrate-binding protein [Aliidongia sp.]
MIEIVNYDDHSSAAEAVRAFQRAVSEDKVNAVIASYVSEVVLTLEPWSARLKTVLITPGAASDVITENIAKDYEHNKYTFHGYLTSSELSELVCDAAKDLLVEPLKMKTAVVVSEDAAWTKPLDDGYLKCLPTIGLQVLDHVRFSPDTTDFTPIFNKVEGEKPDVMITGISHVGTQPTVQWTSQQVPIPDVRHLVAGNQFDLLAGTPTAPPRACCSAPSPAPASRSRPRRCLSSRPIRRSTVTCRPMPASRPMTRSTTSPRRSTAPARPTATALVTALEGDRLCRHDRPRPVPAQGRSACPWAEDWPGCHHRADAAMAGRQAGQSVAEEPGQRQADLPVLHQDCGKLRGSARISASAGPERSPTSPQPSPPRWGG